MTVCFDPVDHTNPKKGAALLSFFMKGILGLNRKA